MFAGIVLSTPVMLFCQFFLCLVWYVFGLEILYFSSFTFVEEDCNRLVCVCVAAGSGLCRVGKSWHSTIHLHYVKTHSVTHGNCLYFIL